VEVVHLLRTDMTADDIVVDWSSQMPMTMPNRAVLETTVVAALSVVVDTAAAVVVDDNAVVVIVETMASKKNTVVDRCCCYDRMDLFVDDIVAVDTTAMDIVVVGQEKVKDHRRRPQNQLQGHLVMNLGRHHPVAVVVVHHHYYTSYVVVAVVVAAADHVVVDDSDEKILHHLVECLKQQHPMVMMAVDGVDQMHDVLN
jgi:hypothetical protein